MITRSFGGPFRRQALSGVLVRRCRLRVRENRLFTERRPVFGTFFVPAASRWRRISLLLAMGNCGRRAVPVSIFVGATVLLFFGYGRLQS